MAARVAYNLLRTSDNPGPEEIRMFEDICMTLRTSNGTFRTTFPGRFRDVDAASLRWIASSFRLGSLLRVQDRAASTGLTSAEWWGGLSPAFPALEFEASDLLLELMELSAGEETFVVEPNGLPLQYIRPPFVTSLSYPESWRNPILRWVSSWAKRRFRGLPGNIQPRAISCIHPQARQLLRTTPGFRFVVRSVFECTPAGCDVLRTMNILNLSYFPAGQLIQAVRAIFDSLVPGGLWIVGRSLESDLSNHASILRRHEDGWEVLERIGQGSEIEDLALRVLPIRA